MTKQRTRRGFLAGTGAAALTGLAGCASLTGTNDGSTPTATVFHAGSLGAPWSDAEEQFEKSHDIAITRAGAGSVKSTKKVTSEPHKPADALGVSDFRLIRDMVLPEYSSWYGIFATNAMTVAYTDQSKYADEFGPDTWYDVLARDDVSVAHSDPAADPNGYRSVMAMELGAIELDGTKLYGDSQAQKLKDNAVVGGATESALLQQLQSGKLDYAWEYQSAGASHDVKTVDLQPHVDLSKATQTYAEHYANAEVNAGGNTYTGAPIAYGITVPSTGKNPEAGATWVEFMATDPGQQIMAENGFQPVAPMVVPAAHESDVPETVMQHATAKQTLGPLEL
ncbi:extracellular solute-binding protein [Salarchaeum sp. JOR-1]|uniref:extracellular solute-binding protein n=1 Tax=Salarchaeum sp. JOR-1 TaxID=2599399 RepID=UPI0011982CC9|nr:extracellular solute-binding protein [Salarchaeum sp. JOR-1]QDX40465.1 extracellular solute-binding protein [Salarchaeum sp. JOR-1]